MPSFNAKRIESDIEKTIPVIIQREAKDEILKTITVTGCHLSHDLSYCKVYFTSLLDIDHHKLESEVNRASGFIRANLSKMLEIRNTPIIHFEYDNTLEYAKRIDDIVESIHEND